LDELSNQKYLFPNSVLKWWENSGLL